MATQNTRIGELQTALGQDKLVLKKFDGYERVSDLFEFTAIAMSTDKEPLNFDTALGKNATIKLQTLGEGERFFVGTLTETQYIGSTTEGQLYQVVLRPFIYLASLKINSQIFHNMTAPAIIAEVLKPYGPAVEDKCSGAFPEIEYCVQHRESDFAFACRLMEAHGISYHFEFTDGVQKMIISTGSTIRDDMPGAPGKPRKYNSVDAKKLTQQEHLVEFMAERFFTTGKVVSNDYDFVKPTSDLIGNAEGDAKYDPGKLEHYEQLYNTHLGKNITRSDGDFYAAVRTYAYRAEDGNFIATGDAVCLTPGYLMELTDHKQHAGEYMVLQCEHHFTGLNYRSTAAGLPSTGTSDGGASYSGEYVLVPKAVHYAPPMITPKPIIAGVQTARVVAEGSSEAEIDADEHGRILVHFHWNREAETKPKGQSMRVRVLQVWAGANWGAQFIPRRGQEVLVQFVEGDPDRPVVVGSLYNGDNKYPYPFPGEKNWTGFKSNSTEGGGGYNEYVFNDTKGEELIRQHAQFNLDSTVENDETHLIKHDQTSTIENDRTTTITNDDTTTIKHDRTTTITNNDTLTAMNEISITATSKITLTVGQSSITMEPGSITIKSTSLKTEGTGSADHSAGGIMTIKGALVKIN